MAVIVLVAVLLVGVLVGAVVVVVPGMVEGVVMWDIFFAAPKDSLVGIVGSVCIFSARFGMVELL